MNGDVERAAQAVFETDAYDGVNWDQHVALTEHRGDCTNEPFSCARCAVDECRQMARAALLAYHRSRTPSPEEVEAVADAICREGEDDPEWNPRECIQRKEHLAQARAALAASDAYRVKELERMG